MTAQHLPRYLGGLAVDKRTRSNERRRITDNLLMMRQFVGVSVSINYYLYTGLVRCTVMHSFLVTRYVYALMVKKMFSL